MSDLQYRAFLNLLMCSDPWPVTNTGDGTGTGMKLLEAAADEEGIKRGYNNWIEAYHFFMKKEQKP